MKNEIITVFDSRVPSPSPAIAAAVYLIADIMAAAPTDSVGNRIMAVEPLVMALVGKGIPTATAREAVHWAWERDCLRRHSRPGEYPQVLQNTITLRQIGNGEHEDFIGPRPQADRTASKDQGESQQEQAPAVDQTLGRLLQLVGDGDAIKILSIARDQNRSAEDRLQTLVGHDRRLDAYDSVKWGELLDVTPAAIRQTDFWKNRNKRRERL